MRSDEKITKPFYRVSYTKRFEDDKDYLELFYYGNNALDVFADFYSENFDDEPEGLELAKLLPNYDEEKDEFKLYGEFFDGFGAGMCAEGLYYDLEIRVVGLDLVDGAIELNKLFVESATDAQLGAHVRKNMCFPNICQAEARYSKEDVEISRVLQEQV